MLQNMGYEQQILGVGGWIAGFDPPEWPFIWGVWPDRRPRPPDGHFLWGSVGGSWAATLQKWPIC